MMTHNQHMAVQLQWALQIIRTLASRNTSGHIDYAKILTWVRYVHDNYGTQGSLNNQTQFIDNNKILINVMREWVKPEEDSGGDKAPADYIGGHSANHFTSHVMAMIQGGAGAIQIFHDTFKLLKPSAEATYYLVKMQWFNLSKRDVGTTPQSVWGAVNKFATAANGAIPGTAIEEHVKIYSQDIIARFVGICAKLFHDESSVAYIARIMEGDAKGIPMNMESFHDRSSTAESERLGNASAAITRWT
jgi:hypothetical protein